MNNLDQAKERTLKSGREHSAPLEGGPLHSDLDNQNHSENRLRAARFSKLEIWYYLTFQCWKLKFVANTADQREPKCGQMQPLAISFISLGSQIPHSMTIRSHSPFCPANSHVGVIWSTKIKEGTRIGPLQRWLSWKNWLQTYIFICLYKDLA